MLGVVGFSAAAIAIIFFVFSYRQSYPQMHAKTLNAFSTAYFILALVMLMFAGGLLFASGSENLYALLIGADVAIFIASGLLLSTLWRGMLHPVMAALLTLVAGIAVGMRAFVYEPTAFIHNGILHFNLEDEPRFVILGLLLLVWLPATVVAAWRAIETVRLPQLKSFFVSSYVVLVLVTATFFSARREEVIIITFAMFVASFVALGAANLLVRRYVDLVGVKKGKGHARKR